MGKTYKAIPGGVKPLATGLGACVATDRITVDGRPVCFMYREAPDMDVDSGWRFMAGDEDQDYMDDADNHGIFDVNTIANYCPEIVPHLKAPVGAAFERERAGRPFVAIDFSPEEE